MSLASCFCNLRDKFLKTLHKLYSRVSPDSLWIYMSFPQEKKAAHPASEPGTEPVTVKRRRVEPPGSGAAKLQVTGATGRELGDMVGSWFGVEMRWEEKYIPTLRKKLRWLEHGSFQDVLPICGFSHQLCQGSLNYPLGEDQTIQRYLARLVDFPSKLRILWVVNLMTPVWFLVYRRGPQYLKIQGVISRIFRAVLIPMVQGWLVSNCTVGVRCIQTLTFLNG